jgi:hypothetical protein
MINYDKNMTAQIQDKIIYKGSTRSMASEPLGTYLKQMEPKHDLAAISTGCWRGYESTWLVENEKLYLTGFKGNSKSQGEVDMNYLFPGQTKVFAEWFTGEIRLPRGPMLKYVHMGYGSMYLEDLYISFEKGRVTGERIVDNWKEFLNTVTLKPVNDMLPKKKTSFLARLKSKLRKITAQWF